MLVGEPERPKNRLLTPRAVQPGDCRAVAGNRIINRFWRLANDAPTNLRRRSRVASNHRHEERDLFWAGISDQTFGTGGSNCVSAAVTFRSDAPMMPISPSSAGGTLRRCKLSQNDSRARIAA